jgi:RNA polymerase sigma factor (sigma-70 family)
MTDEQLLAANDYAALHARHADKLNAWLKKRASSVYRNDIDDIVQEAFLALFKNAATVLSVQRYLYQTAMLRFKDRVRSENRQRRDAKRTTSLDNTTVYNDCIAQSNTDERTHDAQETVADLLARLPVTEAAIVRLMDLEGHTAKSAAAVLDLPMTTVQWRHRQARKRLRRQ